MLMLPTRSRCQVDHTRDDAMCDRFGSACDDAGQNLCHCLSHESHGVKAAGQGGFKLGQLTRARGLTQCNAVALYLLREISLYKSARYVERRLGALHSGRMAPAKRNSSNCIEFDG